MSNRAVVLLLLTFTPVILLLVTLSHVKNLFCLLRQERFSVWLKNTEQCDKIEENLTMQPSVDEFQSVVWWYVTVEKAILDISGGNRPPLL